jgi:hypothetical protein
LSEHRKEKIQYGQEAKQGTALTGIDLLAKGA